MKISTVLRLCMAMFGGLYAECSMGEDVFYLGYERGDFYVDNAGYRPDTGVDGLSAGATNDDFTLQVGSLKFDNLNADETGIAYRKIEGASLQLGKVFRLSKMLKLEVAYGRFWWQTRDVENDIQVGKQSGADRLLEAQLSINTGQVGLYVSRKQMREVAGNDLFATMFGMRYSFK